MQKNLIITAIFIDIREQSCTLLAQLIVVGIPFIALITSISMLPTLPIAYKIIIPILYALCIPFIPYIEDVTATCNIFELAFDITWDIKLKDFCKKILKH